jgi:succinate dehydrogenase/fumarate reductase flavoprotein subunit
VLARTLQELMWDKVGVVRSKEPLVNACAGLDELRAKAGDLRVGKTRRSNPELLDALELRSMLVTAEMVANSALRRHESRGAHVRLDYPDRDDEHWQANIVIRRQEDSMVLAVEPIGRASVQA